MKAFSRRAAVAAAALLLEPLAAAAQQPESCVMIEQESHRLEREKRELLAQYPGTLVAIGVCVAAAESSPPPDQAGIFFTCLPLTCAVAGYANCVEVGRRAFVIQQSESDLAARNQRLSCG